MNQTLIKNVNIWTMDEKDTRFYGWVLLENGKIASMGEGEPPAMPVQIDGDVVYGEGGVLTFGFNPVNTGNMLFRATPEVFTRRSMPVAWIPFW